MTGITKDEVVTLSLLSFLKADDWSRGSVGAAVGSGVGSKVGESMICTCSTCPGVTVVVNVGFRVTAIATGARDTSVGTAEGSLVGLAEGWSVGGEQVGRREVGANEGKAEGTAVVEGIGVRFVGLSVGGAENAAMIVGGLVVGVLCPIKTLPWVKGTACVGN